jgi:hypothetical protein
MNRFRTFPVNGSKYVVVIFSAYMILTVLFASLGYMNNLDNRIRGVDSVFYYIYLPSVLIDGDVDFENNLLDVYGYGFKIIRTPSGLADNVFSIGPAILWSPFFLLAHIVTLISRFFGSTIEANGYSYYYTLFVYIGNSFYGFLGVLFTALFLKNILRPRSTLTACLSTVFASQLTYYFWSFTAMSHNVSFAMASLFFLIWWRKGIHPTTALAAIAMILARWQNALLLLPLFATSAKDLLSAIKNHEAASWLKQHFYFGIILMAGFIPQSIVWWKLYGSPFLVPQGSSFLNFSDLPVWQVLFSTRHGLFSWHPVLLIGLLGLILFWKERPFVTAAFFGVFLFQLILNTAVDDWWASWSFGHRRFISLLPIFTLGLGLVLERISKRWFIGAIVILILLSVWNQLFIYQYQHALISRSEALSFQEMFRDKFQVKSLKEARQTSWLALEALDKRNFQRGFLLAQKAYLINPDYSTSRPVYGLFCLYANNDREGKKVFREWLDSDPENILPRWGLAELFLRQADYTSAARLFSKSSSAYSQEDVILESINNKSKSIMNRDFIIRYNTYLKKIFNND